MSTADTATASLARDGERIYPAVAVRAHVTSFVELTPTERTAVCDWANGIGPAAELLAGLAVKCERLTRENTILTAQLADAHDRNDTLWAALVDVANWCEAYPAEVFTPPTPEQLKKAHEVLQQHVGIAIDQISAAMGRHILGRLKRDCEAALKAGKYPSD